MKDARLPGSMRMEAARMEERADHYREFAGQLDAKAARLRTEAERVERQLRAHGGNTATPVEDHPWRNKGAFKNNVRRPSAAVTATGNRRVAASGLAKGLGPREGGGRSGGD